jgi:hypothetical protein
MALGQSDIGIYFEPKAFQPKASQPEPDTIEISD